MSLKRVVTSTLVAALFAVASSAERPRVYCIQGATVVPAPGESIEGGSIVIRDGLIEAVGQEVAVPPDAVILEGEGLWVYAGLIDPVVELAESQDGSEEKGKGTSKQAGPVHPLSLVHPEVRASDTLLPFSGERMRRSERLRELGFTTVLAVPSSGLFSGTSAAVQLLDEKPVSEIILKNDVAQHLSFQHGSFGADYPTSLMGSAAAIRQVILDTRRHSEWKSRYEAHPQGMKRPEHVASYEALAQVAQGDGRVIFHTENAQDTLLASNLCLELGLNASIVASSNVWEVADEIRSAGLSLILPVAFPEKPGVDDDDEALDVSIRTLRRYLEAPASASRLHRAGVTLALTTHGLKTLSDFRKNLRKMLNEELPEATALAALTTMPARILGLETVVGTLEAGKIANVAVFDGPIFAEESAARHVFVDGIQYRIEEKEKPPGGDPEAVVDPRGEWAVVLELPSGSKERRWILEGEPGNYGGTAETRSGKVVFEAVTLTGNMLTVVLPGQGGRGPLEITVVIQGDGFQGSAELGPRTVLVEGTRTRGPEGGAS